MLAALIHLVEVNWPTLAALLTLLSFMLFGFMIPSKQLTGIASATTGVGHYYANGTSGNDSWDGLAATNTAGTLRGPKLTLRRNDDGEGSGVATSRFQEITHESHRKRI